MKTSYSLITLFTTFVAQAISSPLPEKEPYEIVENHVSTPILNPNLAERELLKIRLSNGLEALLISDPQAKKAAAALCVEAGSWEDPKEYPGMAHFLEHMLFMGTEAYPEESAYSQYITDHGGQLNAATAPDHTFYMFSVNNEAFEGALSRFAHFFIDPLFSTASINKELHAVDQEHAKNVEHDGYRGYMVFKETSNTEHPQYGFCTGNAQTLSGIPQSALKKWFQEHYHADIMHLVVVSSLPLETLKSQTVSLFSQIKQSAHPQKTEPFIPMTSPEQRGHKIYIKPIKDLKNLSLTWEMPEGCASLKDQDALEAIAYVLGSKCSNTLFDQLKKTHIAESVDAHIERYSKDVLLFHIDIALTDEGIFSIDEAIRCSFQALARLKTEGIPEPLFAELKNLTQMHYQYQSREEPFKFVMDTADTMIYENLETFPEKTSLLSSYDPERISTLLNLLQPKSAIYFIYADPNLLNISMDNKEKWMGVEYTIQEIPQTSLSLWAEQKPDPFINLPTSNPFIPSNLTLISPSEQSSYPILLENDTLGCAYYAQDFDYLVPKTSVFLSCSSQILEPNARSIALTELYIKTLEEELSDLFFFAETAGAHINLSIADLKLQFSVSGYSSNTPLVLKELLSASMRTIPSKENFQLYRQSLLTEYENQSYELPFMQSRAELLSLLFNDKPTGLEKEKALHMLSYEEFVEFCFHLHKSLYIEATFYGNLSQEEASLLWRMTKEELNPSSNYPKENRVYEELLTFPENKGPYLLMQSTQRQGHSTFLLLQQGASTPEKLAYQQVLGKVLQEAFYDTLRTKQQTGYIAKAWPLEAKNQLFQLFAVQSSSYHPMELLARFELFLEDFIKTFDEKLPQERFEKVRSMLVASLKIPPPSLEEMGARMHALAFLYEGNFERIEQQINSLQLITYEKLKTYTLEVLSRANTKRLALLMEGTTVDTSRPPYQQISKQDLRACSTYAR